MVGELVSLLQFLYDAGAAIIPWVLLSLAVWFSVKMQPHFVDWVKARAEAQRSAAESKAELNEIIRHNSAVIENNTAAVNMIQRYIDDSERQNCAAVERHEQLSVERFERLQDATDRAAHEVGKIRGEVGVLLDRTKAS